MPSGSLTCSKEAKLHVMDMIFDKFIFQISFINFSNICCWYTLELPHRQFQCATTTYVNLNNECFYHIRSFTNFSTNFIYFSVMSM